MEAASPRPQIRFKLNPHKQEEAILWLANQGENTFTKYFILKMLYYAEKYHLNHYGRPVVGDILSAMPDGPVPSLTYDLMKAVLSKKVQKDFEFKSDARTIHANRAANKDYLSTSDIKALKYGFDKCKNLSFMKLKKMSHTETDYLKAWDSKGSKGSNDIDLNDTIDLKIQTEDSKFLTPFSRHIKV